METIIMAQVLENQRFLLEMVGRIFQNTVQPKSKGYMATMVHENSIHMENTYNLIQTLTTTTKGE